MGDPTADLFRLVREALGIHTVIRFRVDGLPAPQGSKQLVHGKGKAAGKTFLIEDNAEKKRLWRTVVSIEARRLAASLRARGVALPLDGPLYLGVIFYRPKPPSTRRRYPHTAPDSSKLLRALEDSLTGILIRDDCRVVRHLVAKDFGEPGALVEIGQLDGLLPKPVRMKQSPGVHRATALQETLL